MSLDQCTDQIERNQITKAWSWENKALDISEISLVYFVDILYHSHILDSISKSLETFSFSFFATVAHVLRGLLIRPVRRLRVHNLDVGYVRGSCYSPVYEGKAGVVIRYMGIMSDGQCDCEVSSVIYSESIRTGGIHGP